MSFLSRLFGFRRDPRNKLRPLWHRVVEISRRPGWYAELGMEDSVTGRFDMITAVLALVLLRMEQDEALAAPSAHLTELFVEDMDGQLRESGVGDQLVGKHIGQLMSVLGGRLGALRDALAQEDDAELVRFAERNLTCRADAPLDDLAAGLRSFAGGLARQDSASILAGQIQ